MHNPWARRIILSFVSVLTASFAFIGFVEGPAGASTITQSSPTTGTATTATAAAFASQLVTAGNSGTVTYVEATSAHSTQVIVSDNQRCSSRRVLQRHWNRR